MVINSLSLEDINQKTPYKVWMSDKDRSFRFMSDAEIVFVVDFMADDLISSGNTFQLIIGNIGNKKSPRDYKVRDTILAIVEEFFEKNVGRCYISARLAMVSRWQGGVYLPTGFNLVVRVRYSLQLLLY